LFNIENIKIQTLSANHIVTGSREKALHYLFRSGGINWLYATDGAWLPESTWLRLAKCRLNFLIWDATIGNIKGDYRVFEHNSLDMIKIMSDTLKTQGILGQDSIILLTHMARTLHLNHEDTERMLSGTGIIPAYDGLCISFE
jgi:hypothetical protein